MEEHEIIFTIKKFKGHAPIVRQVGAYLVLAQNEADFRSKARKINIVGDRKGFYTLEEAYRKASVMK